MKRLKPIRPAPVVTPQCSVPFDDSIYCESYRVRRHAKHARLGWSNSQCSKPSSYEIDDKCYCTQHASMIALKILMDEGRASGEDAAS